MEILKKLRKAKGISTTQIANIFHVSKRTIENYESGKTNPDFDTLRKFAKFFGVTIDYLLENEPNVIFISKKEYDQLLEIKKVISNIELREQSKSNYRISDNISIGDGNTIQNSFNKK